jgi:monoamine oxidase
MSSDLELFDTVIVGAGVAGITCAYELVRRAGQSYKVRILEASSVWGGRVRKIDPSFASFPVDIGGGWIHENAEGYPNAKVLASIVNDPTINVTTQTAVDDKPFVYFEDGNRTEYPPTGDGGTKVLDEIFINSTWYDFFATYIYPTVQNHIQFNCPVTLIDYSETAMEDVYLECEGGEALIAKNVIVTASLEVLRAGLIIFQPSFPEDYTSIFESYSLTRVLKGFITFRDAFYEQGTSFEIYSPPIYGEQAGNIFFGTLPMDNLRPPMY